MGELKQIGWVVLLCDGPAHYTAVPDIRRLKSRAIRAYLGERDRKIYDKNLSEGRVRPVKVFIEAQVTTPTNKEEA